MFVRLSAGEHRINRVRAPASPVKVASLPPDYDPDAPIGHYIRYYDRYVKVLDYAIGFSGSFEHR